VKLVVSLKKDEFARKCDEFNIILKNYNIDTFSYIEKLRKNVIKLPYIPPCDDTILDYNFLMGLLSGLIISSGFYIIHRKK
jgi:hypothetical protein